MGTNYIAPTWRQPENTNKDKLSNYSIDTSGTSVGINCGSMADLFGTASVTYNTSYSIWIKPEFNYNDSTYQTFFGNYASGNNAVLLYYQIADDRWRFLVGDGAGFQFVSSAQITSNEELGKGEWQHHCVVFDTVNNNAYYYINNQQINSSTSITKKIATAGDFYIGKKWDLSTGTFTGQISQGCIFDYALSTEQRTYLYNLNNPMAITGAKPIAYWPLGDNSNLIATAGYPNISTGADSVFDFDGSNKITLPDIPFLRGGGQNFSVSAWVNTTSGTQVAYFGSRVAPSSTNTIYFFRNSAGGVVLQINNSSTGNIEARSSVTLPNNEWHHVAATFDGSEPVATDRIKIYVDGVLSVGYQAGTGTNLPSGTTGVFNFIGALNIGLNQTGEMSNVAIWDSTLIGSEITTLYNNGQPLMTGTQPEEANLKAWYKLNQTANWEADTAGNWQIPDAVSSYPQSFNFVDGNSTRITSNFNLPTSTTNFSFSAWINPNSTTAAGVFIANNDSGTDGYNAFISSNNIYFRINGNDVTGSISGLANTWIHVVGTYDGTTQKLYINNSSPSTNSVSTSVSVNDVTLIGAREDLAGAWFDGQISNVQIWTTTLSATGTDSVETLYNNGVPLTTAVASSNLKAWYKLDNNDVWNPVLNQWEIIDYAN